MPNPYPRSQYGTPMFVDNNNVSQALTRVKLGKNSDDNQKQRELFIQELVHTHPNLIPMNEIEPAFTPLIAVCIELITPVGRVDNLWITPWGGIVLGEAKLVRNPEARREVIAQVLDYAQALSNWNYDDLENAVRLTLKDKAFTLWSLVESETNLNEAQFHDAVQRRLSSSHFLLLIIGDGIKERVEALTAHLQLHAGLHVGLALLELSIWQAVGGLLIVPRILMRTVLIERGVVRIDDGRVRIDAPLGQHSAAGIGGHGAGKVATASDLEFYDQLFIRHPEIVVPLKQFLSEVEEVGVSPEIGMTAKLRTLSGTAGIIDTYGYFWAGGVQSAANRRERPRAGYNYLHAIEKIIGGKVVRDGEGSADVVDSKEKRVNVKALLDNAEQWKQAIKALVEDLGPPD